MSYNLYVQYVPVCILVQCTVHCTSHTGVTKDTGTRTLLLTFSNLTKHTCHSVAGEGVRQASRP